MKWLKKLLFKEEKAEEEVTVERRKYKHRCEICNLPIYEDERWTKHAGHYFHKQCWKNGVKESGITR